MIEAGTRIRHSLAMGIQIERRTAILDPTGISARSFARQHGLGNILTERLPWVGNLTVADPALRLHDVKWLPSLQTLTGQIDRNTGAVARRTFYVNVPS